MKWSDVFWSSYSFVTTTLADVVATGFNVLGSAACIIGGVGLSASNYMNETLNSGYYGGVNINGEVDLNITVIEMNYSFNETMPFQKQLINTSESKSFSLEDFSDPGFIRLCSGGAILAGTFLRQVAANIAKFREYSADYQFDKENRGVVIGRAGAREYLYVNAQALANSIAFASFGVSASKLLLDIALNYLNNKQYTYPAKSNETIDAEFYSGPVGYKDFPLDFSVSKNLTLDLTSFHFQVPINEAVNATADTVVTYGGGIFFKRSDESRLLLGLASGAMTASFWKAGSFFAEKVRHERDTRREKDRWLPDVEQGEYSPIQ